MIYKIPFLPKSLEKNEVVVKYYNEFSEDFILNKLIDKSCCLSNNYCLFNNSYIIYKNNDNYQTTINFNKYLFGRCSYGSFYKSVEDGYSFMLSVVLIDNLGYRISDLEYDIDPEEEQSLNPWVRCESNRITGIDLAYIPIKHLLKENRLGSIMVANRINHPTMFTFIKSCVEDL